MKIAIITDHIPSIWASSINTAKHAHGFYKLGHYIEILSINRIKEEILRNSIYDVHNFYGINNKIKIKYFRDYTLDYFKELKIIGQFLGKINEFLKKVFPKFHSHLDPEIRMYKYCIKSRFDFSYCRRAEFCAFFNIVNKIPTVIEIHSNLKNIVPKSLQLIFNVKDSEFFKGIVTIHEFLKVQMIKRGISSKKILVLEDVVDLKNFKKIKQDKEVLRKELGLPNNKKLVMYCGTLKFGKSIQNILEVARYIDKDIEFYIIGGLRKRKKIWEKRAKKKKISNIKFLGFKKRSLIPKYLKSADILLMPYDLREVNEEWDNFYTSPLKLFEYMASYNPIVSSNIPTIAKIVENNKEVLLAQPGDIKELSMNIKILLNNKDLADKLAENAFKKVKNYTYINRCKKIIEKFS